jgi:hypothetical protein
MIHKGMAFPLGVSKVTGKPKPGYRETGDPVPIAKKLKTGDPDSGFGFWHLVKTKKPEPSAYIYFLIYFIPFANSSVPVRETWRFGQKLASLLFMFD